MNTRFRAGFTLVELFVGMAISSVALTGVLVASFSLQRAFESANYRMAAQEDQIRLLDYITRDLHAASTLSIVNGGTLLAVKVPATVSSSVDLNLGALLTPLLTLSAPATRTTPTSISYYAEGGQMVREVNGAQTVIANTIADLNFTQSGTFVTVEVTFTPQYSNSPTTASQAATRTSSCVMLYGLGQSS